MESKEDLVQIRRIAAVIAATLVAIVWFLIWKGFELPFGFGISVPIAFGVTYRLARKHITLYDCSKAASEHSETDTLQAHLQDLDNK